MEIQESKENNTTNIFENYIDRKLINTSKSINLQIDDIGVTSDGKLAIKSKLSSKEIYIILGEYNPDSKILSNENQHDINYFFNNLRDINAIYDTSDLIGSNFTAHLSDDIKKLGLEKEEHMYDIKIDENICLEEVDEKIYSKIYAWNQYIYNKVHQNPWINKINNVTVENQTEFTITIQPIEDYEIKWSLEIPFQVDINKNNLTQLIDEKGFGDPRNLEGKEVAVIHKNDIEDNSNIIAMDSRNEWGLIRIENCKREISHFTLFSSNIDAYVASDMIVFSAGLILSIAFLQHIIYAINILGFVAIAYLLVMCILIERLSTYIKFKNSSST